MNIHINENVIANHLERDSVMSQMDVGTLKVLLIKSGYVVHPREFKYAEDNALIRYMGRNNFGEHQYHIVSYDVFEDYFNIGAVFVSMKSGAVVVEYGQCADEPYQTEDDVFDAFVNQTYGNL